MDGDLKRRMGVWCFLVVAALLLVIVIGIALFFAPGHGGGLLDKGKHPVPAQRNTP